MQRPRLISPLGITQLSVVVVLLVAQLSLLTAPVAAATTWYVSTTTGDNHIGCGSSTDPCQTIFFAIDRAAAGDIINIASGTYLENLSIQKSLTLIGASADTTIVDGRNLGKTLEVTSEGDPGINVTITKLGIANGGGGGIYHSNSGSLTISSSRIFSNTSSSSGAGIFNQGKLTLTDVVLSNNRSTTGAGGGLYNLNDNVTLANVTISNNKAPHGGGIGNFGVITMTNVIVNFNQAEASDAGGIENQGGRIVWNFGSLSFNQADLAGGGIYNAVYQSLAGQIQLNRVTVEHNTAANSSGGGAYNEGSLTLNNLTMGVNFAKNGGGIFNTSSAQATINNTWIYSNTAQTASGGGINNQGTLNLTASAVTNNSALALQGGGIYNAGNATLVNATISDNKTPSSTGGGLYNTGGTTDLKNVTVSNNTQPGVHNASGTVTLVNTIVDQSCNGTLTSNGHNLETGTTCHLNASGDITNTNPLLGLLQNNGGPTPSRTIFANGPEIDRGDNGQCPSTDQRGLPRPQGDFCDIGAIESVTFSNNTGGPIVPNGCITSTISVNTSPVIGKLTAGVNLDFTPRGYLSITLASPHHTIVRLLDLTLGSGQNLNTTFDDSASSVVTNTDQISTPPDYRYLFKPYTPLAQVNNTNAHGVWILTICNISGSTGMLNRWQISIPELITNFKTYLPIVRR